MEERLQKVIAQSGYTSRRKAEELIQQGKVTVNGEVVTVLVLRSLRKIQSVSMEKLLIKKIKYIIYSINQKNAYVL